MQKLWIALILSLAMLSGVQAQSAADLKLALVVKNIGNPFFDAVKKGWDEAIDTIGAQSIYRGPEQPTAEGQIEIMESLIAQKVSAITYAANDPQALLPVSKKAIKAGIPINGWESGVVPDSRNISVLPASSEKIGFDQIKIASDLAGGSGEIAILSAASTMGNQNTWIKYMKEALKKPEYKNLKLVATVYGDDLREKSYNEALGLFSKYPKLKVIISPTTVGIAAAGRAVTDKGLIGKVFVTGLGLPSEMAEYVNNGASPVFALWNPVDLGYLNAWVTYHLATKKITGKPGEKFSAGKLGNYTIEAEAGAKNGLVYLGGLFQFNKSNIEDFKTVF